MLVRGRQNEVDYMTEIVNKTARGMSEGQIAAAFNAKKHTECSRSTISMIVQAYKVVR